MRTLRHLTFAVLAAAAFPPAAFADSRALNLGDFVGVDLANGIKAVVVPGAAISVTAQSPRSGDLDDLRTSVSGGVLRAWYDWSLWHVFDFAGRDLTLQITMPELDIVSVSGGANLTANAVPADELRIDASGGAHATVNGAAAKRYTIDISGGAAVKLSGTCYNASIDVSGGATLAAGMLVRADVTGSVSGGAHAEVTATAGVTADASGGGVMTVHGSPAVTKVNSSGGGRVDFSN